MEDFGVMEYFVLCEVRELLAPYGGAYTPTRYMDHIDYAIDMAYASGLESGSILEFVRCHDGVGKWMQFLLERYCWYFKRLVDYTLFVLSKKGILPDLGDELYFPHDIIPPPTDDLGQVAECGDKNYVSFCEQYIMKLFSAAGWSYQQLDYEEIEELGYLKKVTLPFIHRQTGELCCQVDVEIDVEPYYKYYVFTSEQMHFIPEQYQIFCRFCAGASFVVLNQWTVIVCSPYTIEYNYCEMENDWSECCPFSALDAWIYYMERRLFRTPRLEANG